MRIAITTRHGQHYSMERFDVTLDEDGEVTAEDIRSALASCYYCYRVSPERAEFLADEMFRYGEAEHGWSTITYDSGEWA